MKVVVTGAGGFIGFHLVKKLCLKLNPSDIVCLIRSASREDELKSLGFKVIRVDLREKETLIEPCRGAEMVFHLAACVRFGFHGKIKTDFESDNILGTQNLLEACEASVRRFIHMSSVNAVERPLGDPCLSAIDEKSPCEPLTPYGRSKLRSEELVREWAEQKRIDYLILRPPSLVYGPGCHPDSGMARLIQGVKRGSLLMSFNFPGRFSVIHVEDLAGATVQLAFSEDIHRETFFIADEPPRTLLEITSEIARQLSIPFQEKHLPRWIYGMTNGFLSCALKVPGVAPQIPFQLLMLLRDQAAVSSKKVRAFGVSTPISLSQGLRETIPFVLEQSALES